MLHKAYFQVSVIKFLTISLRLEGSKIDYLR
jgi:hypothetical protein